MMGRHVVWGGNGEAAVEAGNGVGDVSCGLLQYTYTGEIGDGDGFD